MNTILGESAMTGRLLWCSVFWSRLRRAFLVLIVTSSCLMVTPAVCYVLFVRLVACVQGHCKINAMPIPLQFGTEELLEAKVPLDLQACFEN